MDKKEKYIKFIVDDLVKKTEIDYDEKYMKFPFFFSKSSYVTFSPTPPFSIFLPKRHFSIYLKDTYGVTDEEVKNIYNLYKERIKSLINYE